jgi:hypothetical protein
MKNSLSKFAALLAVGFGALAAAPAARAVSTLRLSDDGGATWVTISDGAVGDNNGNAGVVTFIDDIGSWLVNVTTGITKPTVGSSTDPYMDLNSVNVSTSGPASLVIQWSDTDFGPLINAVSMVALIGGTTAGTVTYSTYYDPGNALFGLTNQLAPPSVSTPGAFASTFGGLLPATQGQFSITQQIVISHTGAGSSSFDAELKVPEGGATLTLLGGALLGVGLLRRKFAKA